MPEVADRRRLGAGQQTQQRGVDLGRQRVGHDHARSSNIPAGRLGDVGSFDAASLSRGSTALDSHSSCPGLTRASIILRKSFVEEMDCRVKPGNDESELRPPPTT
jgi:hypothetical protein